MKPDQKPEPEPEIMEPGGRMHHLAEKMTSEDLGAAYATPGPPLNHRWIEA